MQSSAQNSSQTSMSPTSDSRNPVPPPSSMSPTSDSDRAARNQVPPPSSMRPTSDSRNQVPSPSSMRPTSDSDRAARNQEPPNDDLLKVESELKPEPFEINSDTHYFDNIIDKFRRKNPDVFFDTDTIFKNKCIDYRLMLPVLYWDIFEIKLYSYRKIVGSHVVDKVTQCLQYLEDLKNSQLPSLEPEPRTQNSATTLSTDGSEFEPRSQDSVSANPNLKLFNYCTVYDFIESCIKDDMRYTENEDSELGTTGNYQKNQLGDLTNYIANTKYYLAGYSEHINKYLFDYVTEDAHFTQYFNSSNRNNILNESQLLNTYKRELLNVIFLHIFLEDIKTELSNVGEEIDKYAMCIEKSKMLKEFNMMVDDYRIIYDFDNISVIINYFQDHRDFDISALETYQCITSEGNVSLYNLMTNDNLQNIKTCIKEQRVKVSRSLEIDRNDEGQRQMLSFIRGPLYNSD